MTLAEKIIDTIYAGIPRIQPDKKTTKQVKLIAHRGAHDQKEGIIENTLGAFENARKLGCWGIELDVQTTQDKEFIVHHDPTLKRLWGIDKAIANLSFKEVRSLVPEIQSLREVIKRYSPSMKLFIELKKPFNAEEKLISILEPMQPCKDYYLLTLDESIFASMKYIDRRAMLLVAVFNNTKDYCQRCLEKGYGGVLGHYLLLTQHICQNLWAAGRYVGTGFIDSRSVLYREINRDIPWLFTNNSKKMMSILKSLN